MQTHSTPCRRRHLSPRTAVALATSVVLGTGTSGTVAEAALSLDPVVGVVSTAVDTTEGLLAGADWGYAPGKTSLSLTAKIIGADQMWARGWTGKGIGVALVDTGAVPVKGLDTPGKVVMGPDLSFESQSPRLRHLDGFGHGTHLAGIIAGNDGTSSGFRGIAPGSTLVDVRVGSSSGAADVSQVIAAVDWVVQHRDDPGLNIRVLNLAFGTDGLQSAQLDPLTHALESAWRAGIVVVVAGGNRGATRPSLDNPATDPWLIAVGAEDPNGTASSLDDVVPSFSSRGSAVRHVDLVAPGQSIVSLRAPGSYVECEYPGAVVDSRTLKGSGTSQAAAVVSGAAALLLQQRPGLTPDQVKQLLVGTARPLLLQAVAGQGAGLVSLAAASAAPTPLVTRIWPVSTGTGTLQGARGSELLHDGSADLVGEQDIFGQPFQAAAWAAASTAGSAWTGGTWNGSTWAGDGWTGTSWASRTWALAAWPRASWGGTSWSGRSWSDQSWSGRSWSGTGWTSRSWSGRSWSGAYWA